MKLDKERSKEVQESGWKSARNRFVQFRKEPIPVGILYTIPILERVFAAIMYHRQEFHLWGKLAREPARQPVMEQASSKASSQPGDRESGSQRGASQVARMSPADRQDGHTMAQNGPPWRARGSKMKQASPKMKPLCAMMGSSEGGCAGQGAAALSIRILY